MASIFEKEPIFSHVRPWDDTTKLPEKFKFSGTSGKAEVHVDSGSLGVEFFYEKTLPDFIQAATKLDWSWAETFSEFENVLAGSYKTAWREVVKDHFSPPDDGDDAANSVYTEAAFKKAVQLFVCTIVDSETPRDVQYVYLAPGGDHRILKDLLTAPRDHARRFKEMLRVTELLPPGETPPPTEKLALQWYYMTYHRADRTEYVKSGKKLADETIESLTAYFQSLFAQRKSDGTLERAEIDRLRNRAKRTIASDLREKREARRTSHARRLTRERERGRYDGSRSYRRDGDDDRRRPNRSERDGRRHDNQPKRGDRDGDDERGGRRDDDGRGAKPGKKPWSKNAEKNKGRRDDRRDDRGRREKHDRRDDAYWLDNRRSSSDDESPNDDHHTDVEEDERSASTASSDVDEDNFAAAIEPPPAKKAKKKATRGSAVTEKEVAPARKRKPAAPTVVPRKRRYIASDSDDDDDDDDENFLASCKKALQRDPLDIN